MSVMISSDGEGWYKVSDEKFHEMLADISVDCWVDLSEDKSFLCMTMQAMRDMRDAEPTAVDWSAKPKTLYGIPIVFEDVK